MIDEILILDADRRTILFGNPNAELPATESPSLFGERMLTTLRCNDVFLAALYKNHAPLHISQLLRSIAAAMPDLDAKKVASEYFKIFDVLAKRVNDAFLTSAESTQMLPADTPRAAAKPSAASEVFVDVFETCTAIIDSATGVVKSDVFGKIFCRAALAARAELRVACPADAKFVGAASAADGCDRVFEIGAHATRLLLATYVKRDADAVVSLRDVADGYEVAIARPLDRLCVKIPVCAMMYKIDVATDHGVAKMRDGYVEWTMTDVNFSVTRIRVKTRSLDNDRVAGPICVEFCGAGNVSLVKVKPVAQNNALRVISYVKYRLASGSYEVRTHTN